MKPLSNFRISQRPKDRVLNDAVAVESHLQNTALIPRAKVGGCMRVRELESELLIRRAQQTTISLPDQQRSEAALTRLQTKIPVKSRTPPPSLSPNHAAPVCGLLKAVPANW